MSFQNLFFLLQLFYHYWHVDSKKNCTWGDQFLYQRNRWLYICYNLLPCLSSSTNTNRIVKQVWGWVPNTCKKKKSVFVCLFVCFDTMLSWLIWVLIHKTSKQVWLKRSIRNGNGIEQGLDLILICFLLLAKWRQVWFPSFQIVAKALTILKEQIKGLPSNQLKWHLWFWCSQSCSTV